MIARNWPGSTKRAWIILAFFVSVAAVCFAVAWPEAAGALLPAQSTEEKPLRRFELLVLEDRSNEVTVGLHVELVPGWYLYWLNPGDAGLAPEVIWKLPAGYEAGKLRFPTPRKFIDRDIVTYGFMEETLILCDIRWSTTEPAADKPMIAAVLDWMACRESCVTGESMGQVNLSGPSSKDLQRVQPIFSRFSERYPKRLSAADLYAKEARLIKTPGRWTVDITLTGRDAARVSDFYPYPLDDFVIDHHRIAIQGGKLVIPVEPANPSAVLSAIQGLFIVDGAGYEVSIPIKQ